MRGAAAKGCGVCSGGRHRAGVAWGEGWRGVEGSAGQGRRGSGWGGVGQGAAQGWGEAQSVGKCKVRGQHGAGGQ